MKRLLVLGGAALLIAVMVGCGGGKDPVLAKVGSRSIRTSDFQKAYATIKPADRPDLSTLEGKQTFLADMVNKELMELAAFEKYPQLTEQQGWRFKRFQDTEITAMFRRRMVLDKISVTKEMKDTIFANMSRDRHVQAMLLPDTTQAIHVLERLAKGEDFGALAKDFSMQWVGDGMAGDLGFIKAGVTFPYPIDVAVWNAPIGALLGPFWTPLGTYVIKVLGEQPAEMLQTREELDGSINDNVLQQLYMNRQMAVLDSLRAAADAVYLDAGKNLIMTKYYWEPPPDQADNPYAKLDADRRTPEMTAEEESTEVVVFKGAPTWNMREFASRLEWYATGLWPIGQVEGEVDELLDMMVRDYLVIKAADDLGFTKDPNYLTRIGNREREMRVTYFYYNDIMKNVNPTPEEIEAWFADHRENYKFPPSYKVSYFMSKDKGLIDRIAADWKGGASFGELQKKYGPKDTEMDAMGETPWVYQGRDPVVDEMVASLQDGEVGAPMTRADMTMVLKLVSRQGERIPTYQEVKETIDKDAKVSIGDKALNDFLKEQEKKFGVRINEKALAKFVVETPAPVEESPDPAMAR
jgi:parvulin-like peptidyl-prolyl isomerase